MNSANSVYKVSAEPLVKEIIIPSSKSYANRALIMGALLGNGFRVENLSSSTDVINLIKCFEKIGLSFSYTENEIEFHNAFPECEIKSNCPITLQTGDGGTTNRFLLALLALGKNEYQLIPSEKMSERPMDELVSPLKKLGATINNSSEEFWISIKGPIAKSEDVVEVDCSKSTQFATALSLIGSVLNFKVQYIDLKSSADYLKMTDAVIDHSLKHNNFIVPVDFSSLSYPAVLAALNGEVLIKNCFSIDPLQADATLFEVFKTIGVNFEFTEIGLKIKSNLPYKTFQIDGSKCPDLVMSLVVLATKIIGESQINNLSVLKHKESDRLLGIIKTLQQFNVDFKYDELNSKLVIRGSLDNLDSCNVFPERDHRMVMMNYMMLRLNNGGVLYNADCVEKSYPNFYQNLA